MNKINMPLRFFMVLCLFSTMGHAVNLSPGFKATYVISRGGKPTAEQSTIFAKQINGMMSLTDTAIGTHGLASFTGFERTEHSLFKQKSNQLRVYSHRMNQAVAFSKKSFRFDFDEAQQVIHGKAKKPFSIPANTNPLSTHVMPLWIGALVCSGKVEFSLPVIKSKKVKTYHFTAHKEGPSLVRVERDYGPEAERSTHLWYDTSDHCLLIRSVHKKGNDPAIETKMISHQFETAITH